MRTYQISQYNGSTVVTETVDGSVYHEVFDTEAGAVEYVRRVKAILARRNLEIRAAQNIAALNSKGVFV